MFWTIASTVLTLIVSAATYVFYKLHQKNQYWAKKGVKGPKPVPIFGNAFQLNSIGQVQAEKEWAKTYGDLYGLYIMVDPVLTITDPELIKTVLVKDFHVFVNRDVQPFEHEIWSLNLFNSEDEQWKRIRAIISPSMTTGKLRGMHMMMERCVEKLSDYLDSIIADSKSQGALNIKEAMTGFALDVIASTSFATDVNITDRSKKNLFLTNAVHLFEFKLWRFALLFLLPDAFNRAIGNSIGLNDKRFNFFRDLARAIIRKRKEAKVSSTVNNKRSDIVQLMMDAYVYEDSLRETSYSNLTASEENDDHQETILEQKMVNGSLSRSKKTLTENEIIAQCILIFAAGFETTATATSIILYFLSLNPEIQQRLVDELSSSLEGIVEESSEYYEVVNKLPYLEAVIKETLRISPPVGRLQRRVGVDGYKLGGIELDKNVEVDIGVLAVHHNPKYYPEPEVFNPDRFLPENKHLLTPYTFLVFGDGPRNCMGMRFAYQEIKLCLAKIVRRFAFERTEHTKVPLDYDKIGFLTCRNIPLKVSRR